MPNLSRFRLAMPLLLLLLLTSGCGPDLRKPFVGVWRLDAKYFREQLEKQEFKSEEAKKASDENIPLWESYKVEFTFSEEGRYQMSTQLHDSKVVTIQGRYEVPDAASPTLQLFPEDEDEAKPQNLMFRFINGDLLELETDMAIPGKPKKSRYQRAKSEEMNARANKKAAP